MGDTDSGAQGTTPAASSTPQAGGTPGGTVTPPQAGNTPAPQAGAGNPSADGEELMSLAEARKLRAENAGLRDKNKAFEDAAEAERVSKLDELGKVQVQLTKSADTIASMREVIGNLATQVAAAKLGIIDPDAAAILIGPNLKYGDDHRPSNAEDLLKELLKTKPYLKAPEPSTPAPKTNNGPANPGGRAPASITSPAPNPYKPVSLSDAFRQADASRNGNT